MQPQAARVRAARGISPVTLHILVASDFSSGLPRVPSVFLLKPVMFPVSRRNAMNPLITDPCLLVNATRIALLAHGHARRKDG